MKHTHWIRNGFIQTLAFAALFTAASPSLADSVTIYAIPSAHGNDHSTPRRLGLATARNYRSGYLYRFGHVAFHLQCESASDGTAPVDILDGINVVRLTDYEYLTTRLGYGLGTIFSVMDGHFEGRETTRAGLKAYMDAGAAAFVKFDISAPTCQRMVSFIEEYKSLGLPDNYGMTLRPRHKEGANCATFGAALLEVGGLADTAMMQSWRISLRVPTHLVGGPLTGRRVPAWFFFARPFWARRWATAYEPHYYAEYYDPGLLYNHIRNRWQQGLSPINNWGFAAQKVHNGNTLGFVVDATSAAVPEESFWMTPP